MWNWSTLITTVVQKLTMYRYVESTATAAKSKSVVWKYFKKVASQHGAKLQCDISNKTVKTTSGSTLPVETPQICLRLPTPISISK